jgi:hypothetical protein
MIAAFRDVFGAATAMLATTALCMILMEERPLAGPAKPQPVEMAEQGVTSAPFPEASGL